MKASSGALLVALGLAALWIAATGRAARLPLAWGVLMSGKLSAPVQGNGKAGSVSSGTLAIPALPPLPALDGSAMRAGPR